MGHKLKPKEAVVIEVVRIAINLLLHLHSFRFDFHWRGLQSESPAAAALESIATTLKLGKPPNNAAVNVIFDKIDAKLSEVLQKCGPNQLGSPLFTPTKPLQEKQWKRLEQLRNDLDAEYDIRRQMLITRLDVTIQSFQVNFL